MLNFSSRESADSSDQLIFYVTTVSVISAGQRKQKCWHEVNMTVLLFCVFFILLLCSKLDCVTTNYVLTLIVVPLCGCIILNQPLILIA